MPRQVPTLGLATCTCLPVHFSASDSPILPSVLRALFRSFSLGPLVLSSCLGLACLFSFFCPHASLACPGASRSSDSGARPLPDTRLLVVLLRTNYSVLQRPERPQPVTAAGASPADFFWGFFRLSFPLPFASREKVKAQRSKLRTYLYVVLITTTPTAASCPRSATLHVVCRGLAPSLLPCFPASFSNSAFA